MMLKYAAEVCVLFTHGRGAAEATNSVLHSFCGDIDAAFFKIYPQYQKMKEVGMQLQERRQMYKAAYAQRTSTPVEMSTTHR